MKVLWVCNIMLPKIAEYLNREVSNREGWLVGLADKVLKRGGDVELGVAFPTDKELDGGNWLVPFGDKAVSCYGFYENTADIETHDESVGERLLKILEDFNPDVVHCFGTEYDHSYELVRVWNPKKVLIGIQGVCGAIAEAYFADVPEYVVNRATFRDRLKKDSLCQQKEKFEKRALREKKTLQLAKHVTGRTTLDREYLQKVNPGATYHLMNETLRPPFYEGKWEKDRCEVHSIFVSQGDYPIKGLHYVLRAFPKILEKYPDAKVYVAGNSIVNWKTLKDKIKISSYGKYLRELMAQYGMGDKVIFLGKMTAVEMKEQMLNSNLFVCSSAMENSPNSLGEAMLLGLPCVAADIGGVPDLFRGGVDGILYEGHRSVTQAEDAEMLVADRLAEAVLTMWAEEERMLFYGENARERARVTHDGDANFLRLLEIYRLIAGV